MVYYDMWMPWMDKVDRQILIPPRSGNGHRASAYNLAFKNKLTAKRRYLLPRELSVSMAAMKY